MFGENEKLKREDHCGAELMVREIFYTIQGEGIHAGRAATFIRLAGCHLACSFCDTDFDVAKSSLMTIEDIVGSIKIPEVYEDGLLARLVVLTGGEPMRQPITNLVECLLDDGYEVQIETAGSFTRDLPVDNPDLTLVCSPKTPFVHESVVEIADAWKYIVSVETKIDMDGFPARLFAPTNKSRAPIYYQPMDEGDDERNKRNAERCAQLAMGYGRRLSVQVHKIVGVE